LNGTRVCSGANVEYEGWYNISQNTWAPAANRYIGPWKRSSVPGYINGGNKFDLTAWDNDYFLRLKDFMNEAQKRDIIVEFFFFSAIYEEKLWKYSPMYFENNVNGVGNVLREKGFDLNNNQLTVLQTELVKKIVTELNGFDNLIWEICNEPYFHVPAEWENEIIRIIDSVEQHLPKKHLISQNVANFYTKITNPNPATDIFNFHYLNSPSAILDNYYLNKAIGCNETGFSQDDFQYRKEGWITMMSGGAYFNNLDYSFTVNDETGQFIPENNPGGGGPALRKQLGILKKFMDEIDFISMTPVGTMVTEVSGGVSVYDLINPGTEYSAYISGGSQANIKINIPANTYRVTWMDTKTGNIVKTESIQGGAITLVSPSYNQDIAFRITRTN
jgi:hypothetical protein